MAQVDHSEFRTLWCDLPTGTQAKRSESLASLPRFVTHQWHIQCQLCANFVTRPGCSPPFFFRSVSLFSKPCPKMPHKILPPSWSFMVMNRWTFSAGGVFWPCVLGTAVLMLHSSARSSRARWVLVNGWFTIKMWCNGNQDDFGVKI